MKDRFGNEIETDYGKIAFEEWAKYLDKPYPINWDQHPEPAKAAWAEIAQTVINQYIEDYGPHDVE